MADFFKKMVETASNVGEKTKKLADKGIAKVDIVKLENKVRDKKAELGDLIFVSYITNSEFDYDKVQKLCVEIRDILQEIVDIKEAMGEEKEKDVSGRACPTCGTAVPETTNYCPTCGKRLVEPEDEEKKEVKYCVECGNSLELDATFCGFCGRSQE